ncbi:multifunctional oxoglutarate decarboxylase/oxoglutarate dehydrogenase thiamine pyrophosphate-binding subunit/dihydrolipoyllysine-residue succinyltransferase subunit, partial [Streptomyces scabiei]|uniref:2-oxoglutarate dehydrogenase E1 subunit family protein n=1 Tax=Streptomyces scabiei TaxID=1930 RepID=UPI0029B85133|nr:multifunctional oxoglutarate decarboxylase/oxoglutarate dehydrogenase thiamine pyrophosphate-binding subunit/dihydrolipoyllysine-residue succinyltransferase subunit [Streptomyces scabiei]
MSPQSPSNSSISTDADQAGKNPAAAFGPNEWLVDEIYQQYLQDPNSVDRAWWDFFADYKPGAPAASAPVSTAAAAPAAPAQAAPAAPAAPAPAARQTPTRSRSPTGRGARRAASRTSPVPSRPEPATSAHRPS